MSHLQIIRTQTLHPIQSNYLCRDRASFRQKEITNITPNVYR